MMLRCLLLILTARSHRWSDLAWCAPLQRYQATRKSPALGGSSSTESGTGEQSLDRRLHCERLGKAGQTVLAAFDQRDPLHQLIDLAART